MEYGLWFTSTTTPNGNCNTKVLCRCACGTTRMVRWYDLTSKRSTNCGCLRKVRIKQINWRHGECSPKGETPEHRSWRAMRARCYSKQAESYPLYGGRGIVVCSEWKENYKRFLEDMGRKPSSAHSLDRINNNGNYEPNNCRWATHIEQANNRRPRNGKY